MKSVEEKNVSGTIVYVNLGEPRLETLYEHLSKQEMEDFWRADLDLASSVQDGWTSTEAAGQLEEHAIAEFKRLHDLVRLRQERRRREARRNRERSTPQPTPCIPFRNRTRKRTPRATAAKVESRAVPKKSDGGEGDDDPAPHGLSPTRWSSVEEVSQ